MKLKTLVQEYPNSKFTMNINEAQFRSLAQNILSLQEQKQINNTHLIKTNFNAKKK